MRIFFFGKLRDALGDEREVHCEDGDTVAHLRHRLAQAFPAASADLCNRRVRACIDDSIVGEDFVVSGHDKVEFFPPLSGG